MRKTIILIIILGIVTLTITGLLYSFKGLPLKTNIKVDTDKEEVINIPENADYPNSDLFPYRNLSMGIYANYTNPKEITIYKPDNLTEDQARLSIDADIKNKGSSLLQLENLGVLILIKSSSEVPIQE